MITKMIWFMFILFIIISCGSNNNDNGNNKNAKITYGDPLPVERTTLEGIIQDSNSSPIMGATIKISNSNISYDTTSNSTGFYSIPNIVHGSYNLFVLKEGYITKRRTVGTRNNNNIILFKNTGIPNTWVDNSKNLMWQDEPYTLKEEEHTSYTKHANYKKAGNWKHAQSYCDNLSLHNHNNWYLPDIKQLEDLYTKKKNLNNLASGRYWSSSDDAKYTSVTLVRDFNDEHSLFASKSEFAYIRCVRSVNN